MSERIFLKEWKKENIRLIKVVHPDWDEEKINKKLNEIIDKKLKNPECALVNNYINKTATTTLLDLYDYIKKYNPIIAGGGVLFKNQNEAINPPAIFLDGALKKRKEIKKGLKTAVQGSYEYKAIDRAQLTEKVVANSYYGASGNEASTFYNIYTALATTASGQSLISTMMCAFENFYSNNVKFYDIGDFLLYVKNATKKKEVFIEIADMPDPNMKQLVNKIHGMFKYTRYVLQKEENRRIIADTLSNLNELERKQVFYASNLFPFIKIPSVEKLILKIIYTTKSFKDPNVIPEEAKDLLDYFWELLQSWVVYCFPAFNRINRLKFEKRKCVVTIDTDSNMININRWMEHLDKIIDINKTISKNENEVMYIKCNTLCAIVTKYTQVVLANYCKHANIPDEYAPRLNMKNEYLYLRMILTNKKKSYCGLMRLREGKEFIPEMLDPKGLQFVKSSCPEYAKEYFKALTTEILFSKPISGSMVLKRVKEFAREIEKSLNSGEKKFLNPLSVKEAEAYDKPFSMPGIKGTYIWNSVYPDKEIVLPEKLTVAKVRLTTAKADRQNLEFLRVNYPDIYEKLRVAVFDNLKCSFREKGVDVIAIPTKEERVPDWIIPFIDKAKIINDNISKFHMIMESLGIKMMDTRSNNPHMTNIVNF